MRHIGRDKGLLPTAHSPATKHQDRQVPPNHRRAPSRVRRLAGRRRRRV